MSVSTPCVKLCAIDRESALCEGCGRTLQEISGWARMDEPERRAIMAGLAERLRGRKPTALTRRSATR